jgi:uncharacterized RDD family membrane protein YckC
MNDIQDVWFVAAADGSARGPFARSRLHAMRSAGEIADDQLVWTLTLAEWIPLKRALGNLVSLSAVNASQARASAQAAQNGQPAPAPARPAQAKPAQSKATQSKANQPPRAPQTPARSAAPVAKSTPPAAAAGALLRGEALLSAAAASSGAARGTRLMEGVRRFLARLIDLLFLGGIGWAVLSVVGLQFGLWNLYTPNLEFHNAPILAYVVLVLAALPLEILMLGVSGYTPGKALLGIRVLTGAGTTMGLPVAFRRALAVLVRGQALLIPPFHLFAWGIAWGSLIQEGRTVWDKDDNLQVQLIPIDAQRWGAGLIAVVLAGAALASGLWIRLLWELG